MTRSRLFLALCFIAVPLHQAGALPLPPQLACSTYLAGFAAGDEAVLDEAAQAAQRLIASAWSSPAMKREEAAGTVKGRRDLVLWQLRSDCQILQRENIQNIVAVHMSAVQP